MSAYTTHIDQSCGTLYYLPSPALYPGLLAFLHSHPLPSSHPPPYIPLNTYTTFAPPPSALDCFPLPTCNCPPTLTPTENLYPLLQPLQEKSGQVDIHSKKWGIPTVSNCQHFQEYGRPKHCRRYVPTSLTSGPNHCH